MMDMGRCDLEVVEMVGVEVVGMVKAEVVEMVGVEDVLYQSNHTHFCTQPHTFRLLLGAIHLSAYINQFIPISVLGHILSDQWQGQLE